MHAEESAGARSPVSPNWAETMSTREAGARGPQGGADGQRLRLDQWRRATASDAAGVATTTGLTRMAVILLRLFLRISKR